MKNTKKCPKCQSTEIARFNGGAGVNSSGNYIVAGSTILFSSVGVHRYVCCNCGFVEEWVDKEDIEYLMDSDKANYINE